MKRIYRAAPLQRWGLALGLCLPLLACGSDQGKDRGKSDQPLVPVPLSSEDLCVSSLKKECDDLANVLAASFSLQQRAADNGKLEAAVKAGVEAEHANALRKLYQTGRNQESVEVVNEKERYGYMRKLVESNATNTKPNKACAKDAMCAKSIKEHEKLWQRYQDLEEKVSNVGFKLKVDVNHTSLRMAIGPNDAQANSLLDSGYASIQGIIAEAQRLWTKLGSTGNGIDTLPSRCSEDLQDMCKEKLAKIAELRAAHEAAFQEGDVEHSNQLVLELNQALDELKAYMNGQGPDSDVVKEIVARYNSLRSIVGGKRSSYTVAEQNEVDKVRKDFGDLYMSSTVNDEGEPQFITVEMSGDRKPWSGYWYPFRSPDMFDGAESSSFEEGASPLELFDRLLEQAGRTPGAAAWERSRQETSSWESSDGLCDAWSIASSLTAEPLESVTLGDVKFTPAHLKGLLVQKYTNHAKERYGIPYRGYLETDGLGQDLRPEAFHQLAVKALSEGRSPIVDTDPNFLIWNMPLFRYEWKAEPDPDHAHAFLVTARPWYVKFRTAETVDPTSYFVGRDSNLYLPTYKYRLFYDAAENEGSAEKRILYGEWIVDERAAEHPDAVYMVESGNTATPRNPVVAENLDLLSELIARFE